MCDTEKERKISEKIFSKAKTVIEFMEIWSQFYENKICIPTYLDKFVGADDNPEASYELGKKLKEISQRGVLAVNSQVGIPGNQKQYIIGFMPTKMAEIVIRNINRYSGIVAFYGDIEEKDTTKGLYVTYDAFQDLIKTGAEEKEMYGDPYTHIMGADVDSFEQIREWMSKDVKKKINKKRYSHFVIIGPSFDDPPEYIFDKLVEVLRRI